VPPYASKRKVQDWDKYVADQKDLDDDDPLNKVFKDIYGKGSEEQRRAMMKSYVESGGTVLSTNWEDVGKKTVEVSPPDGMIAKSWKTDEVVARPEDRKEKYN
jgi:suppressor of G2 allele of SKP1